MHCTASILPEGGNQQSKQLCLQKSFWEKRAEIQIALFERRGCGQKVGLPKEGVHKGCTQKSRKRMLWQSMKRQAR